MDERKDAQDTEKQSERACKSQFLSCEEGQSQSKARILEYLIVKAALKSLDPHHIKAVEKAEKISP